MFVYYAKEYILFFARITANGGKLGAAVLKFRLYALGYFVGVGGDNRELIRFLGPFKEIITHKA